MEKLQTTLSALKEALEKAITMPSPKGPKAPTADPAIAIEAPKEPSLTPGSKKDPMKQAQQMEDPDKKAQALKGAKSKMVVIAKNGQWSL